MSDSRCCNCLVLGLATALMFPASSRADANGNANNGQRGGLANGVKVGGNNVNQGAGQQVAPWARQGIQGRQLAEAIAQFLANVQRGNNNAGQGVGRWNGGQGGNGQGFGGRGHGKGMNNNGQNAGNANGKGKGKGNANNGQGNGKGKGRGNANNGNNNNGNAGGKGKGNGHAAGNVGGRLGRFGK